MGKVSRPDLDHLFDKETKAKFFEWCKKNTDRIEAFKKTSDETKTLQFEMMNFQYERLYKAWIDTLEVTQSLHEALERDVPQAVKRGQFAAELHHWDEKQERNAILAEGRKKGLKARKAKAGKNRVTLVKAINDLFAKDDSPGWKWTNDEITEYIQKYHPIYAFNTIKQQVKIVAAKCRKSAKSTLGLKNT